MAGRIALVTGAGGGIGGATAALFCREGAQALLVDNDEPALHRTAERILRDTPGASIDLLVADIRSYEQTARAVSRATERFGGLDALVNNAAIRNVASIVDSKPEAWQDLLAVNLMGAVNFCKAAAPALRRSGHASVVNVSSVYGVVARKNWGIYDATKAALISLTQTFACEEAVNGIRVNAVCVGGTITPHTIRSAEARGLSEDNLQREVRTDNLLRRWGKPEEIAYPILWLASDEASFITGTALMVDAGRSIL
jgi:meso-butanediol dehydrogenase/(S,S)-butanediol dehydrogenase/diacetyl reductase